MPSSDCDSSDTAAEDLQCNPCHPCGAVRYDPRTSQASRTACTSAPRAGPHPESRATRRYSRRVAGDEATTRIYDHVRHQHGPRNTDRASATCTRTTHIPCLVDWASFNHTLIHATLRHKGCQENFHCFFMVSPKLPRLTPHTPKNLTKINTERIAHINSTIK